MAEGIRLLETLVLNGPNYWSYRPCVWMRIDLGPFRDRPSIDIPGWCKSNGAAQSHEERLAGRRLHCGEVRRWNNYWPMGR